VSQVIRRSIYVAPWRLCPSFVPHSLYRLMRGCYILFGD